MTIKKLFAHVVLAIIRPALTLQERQAVDIARALWRSLSSEDALREANKAMDEIIADDDRKVYGRTFPTTFCRAGAAAVGSLHESVKDRFKDAGPVLNFGGFPSADSFSTAADDRKMTSPKWTEKDAEKASQATEALRRFTGRFEESFDRTYWINGAKNEEGDNKIPPKPFARYGGALAEINELGNIWHTGVAGPQGIERISLDNGKTWRLRRPWFERYGRPVSLMSHPAIHTFEFSNIQWMAFEQKNKKIRETYRDRVALIMEMSFTHTEIDLIESSALSGASGIPIEIVTATMDTRIAGLHVTAESIATEPQSVDPDARIYVPINPDKATHGAQIPEPDRPIQTLRIGPSLEVMHAPGGSKLSIDFLRRWTSGEVINKEQAAILHMDWPLVPDWLDRVLASVYTLRTIENFKHAAGTQSWGALKKNYEQQTDQANKPWPIDREAQEWKAPVADVCLHDLSAHVDGAHVGSTAKAKVSIVYANGDEYAGETIFEGKALTPFTHRIKTRYVPPV